MAKKQKKSPAKKASARYKKRKIKPSLVEEPSEVYLTKSMLVRAIKKGTKNLAADAIKTIGYTVIVKNIGKERWVVKVNGDGKVIEKVSRIKPYKKRKIDFSKLS